MTKQEAETVRDLAVRLIPGIVAETEESKVGNWHINVRWPDNEGWSSRSFKTAVSLTAMSAEEYHVHEGTGIGAVDAEEIGEAGVQGA